MRGEKGIKGGRVREREREEGRKEGRREGEREASEKVGGGRVCVASATNWPASCRRLTWKYAQNGQMNTTCFTDQVCVLRTRKREAGIEKGRERERERSGRRRGGGGQREREAGKQGRRDKRQEKRQETKEGGPVDEKVAPPLLSRLLQRR